jgi:hypothetical protein
MGLLLAVLLAIVLEIGHRVGARSRIHQDPDRKEQMATIRDGLFVLASLLLGFTLAMAGPRYAERRSLLVEEAVSIGTSYLRAGTLPQPYREHSQTLLRKYVEARFAFGKAELDTVGFREACNASKHIQEELWADVSALAQVDRSALTTAYMNSLNETIDLHDKRFAAIENRIPGPIWFLIISISMIAVFTRGLTLKARFWLNLILVPITIAIVAALIADLDTPTSGFIRRDQRPMQRLQVDLIVGSAN